MFYRPATASRSALSDQGARLWIAGVFGVVPLRLMQFVLSPIFDSHVESNLVHYTGYRLHYMYSDRNTFDNNTFKENEACAAITFRRSW